MPSLSGQQNTLPPIAQRVQLPRYLKFNREEVLDNIARKESPSSYYQKSHSTHPSAKVSTFPPRLPTLNFENVETDSYVLRSRPANLTNERLSCLQAELSPPATPGPFEITSSRPKKPLSIISSPTSTYSGPTAHNNRLSTFSFSSGTSGSYSDFAGDLQKCDLLSPGIRKMLADKAENLRRVLADQGIEWNNEDLFGLNRETSKETGGKKSMRQRLKGWRPRKGLWKGFSEWLMRCLNARRGI